MAKKKTLKQLDRKLDDIFELPISRIFRQKKRGKSRIKKKHIHN